MNFQRCLLKVIIMQTDTNRRKDIMKTKYSKWCLWMCIWLFSETNRNFDLFKSFCCRPNCTRLQCECSFFDSSHRECFLPPNVFAAAELSNCSSAKNIQNLEDRVGTPDKTTKLMWIDGLQWYQFTPMNVNLWPARIMSIRLNPSGLIHRNSFQEREAVDGHKYELHLLEKIFYTSAFLCFELFNSRNIWIIVHLLIISCLICSFMSF